MISPKTHLKPKCCKFEYELQGENSCEDHVEHIQSFTILSRLVVILHSKCYSVDHDQNEDGILERLGCDKPPDFVLNAMFWDVSV